MAEAGPNVARRSLFAALLAALLVTEPGAVLQPGNIWIQVPEQPWRDFVGAARELAQLEQR